jgi:hypothetical protein
MKTAAAPRPRYLGHRWGPNAPPRRPTLLRPAPEGTRHFEDIKGLARFVARLRKGRPLVIRPTAETLPHTSFAVMNIMAVEFDDSEVWLGAAAIQSADERILMRALDAVDPQAVG